MTWFLLLYLAWTLVLFGAWLCDRARLTSAQVIFAIWAVTLLVQG